MSLQTFFRRAVWSAVFLLAVTAAAQQPRAKKADDPDLKEIRDYRLNMEVIQRYTQAVKAATSDPETKKCFSKNSPGDAPNLDAAEKIFNACPAGVADLKTAGFKPREFLVLTSALIGDFMAVGMKKNGAIKEYPPSISPENAAFVEQNFDKLQAMLAPLAAGGKDDK